MYKDFRHSCQSRHPKPGELWTWMSPEGTRVVNLFTQEGAQGHYGGTSGRASAQHVGRGLGALWKHAVPEKFTSIALPRLATEVGGMQWRDV